MIYTIYSKENCPFCQKIKILFELNEIKFVEYKLDRDFSRQDFYNIFGESSTFPQTIMGDEVLGGCSETIKYLQEKDICCNV